MTSDMFLKLTEQEKLFGQWWGRYVVDLTDEELAAGAASRVTLRAAEAAWKASAFIWQQRHDQQGPAE